MSTQRETFHDVLAVLQQIGLLPHLMLIGSWAEYAYERNYFSNFEANLQTRDVDFLLKNLHLPKNMLNLKSALEAQDFIAVTDPLTEITKFFKGGTLELEFLARELGSGSSKPCHASGLGINVEGLRHMDLLLDNPIICKINGLDVIVPAPHAYILHKLLINKNRRPEKRDKDIRSVIKLLEAVYQMPGELGFLRALFTSLPVKQRKSIQTVCGERHIDIT